MRLSGCPALPPLYGAHTKTDLKVDLVWIPKYRKRVLAGELAVRVRDLIRQIAMEHELTVLSGKVARDHVHVFVSDRPNQDVSTIVQWLKGISSRVLLQELPHLRKAFCCDLRGRAESLPPPRPGATVSVAQARERGELLGEA